MHLLRSIPVKALHERMAVFTSVRGLDFGSGPSRDGHHAPPIAMSSLFPLQPSKNCKTNEDLKIVLTFLLLRLAPNFQCHFFMKEFSRKKVKNLDF